MKALITATAYKDDEVMRLHTGEPCEWQTESSTDLPAEYLGEAAVLALGMAWRTGIDPAIEDGFHIRLTFGVR